MKKLMDIIIDAILVLTGMWIILLIAAPFVADTKEIDQTDDDISEDEEREKFYKEIEEDLKIHDR